MTKYFVLYHAHCLDGLGAAYAFYRYYGDHFKGCPVEYRPVQYSDPVNVEEFIDAVVNIVDFSFPNPILQEICDVAKRVTVIDHHVTAIAALKCFEHPRFVKYLSTERSGAALAWQYVWPEDHDIPRVIKHIEDRDLWRFQLPGTKEITTALRFMDIGVADLGHFRQHPEALEELLEIGDVMLRYERHLVKNTVARAWVAPFADHAEVKVVNCDPNLTSEVGNILAEASPSGFAVMFHMDEHYMNVSLRSTKASGVDVSKIAGLYGGGGHPNAAGFRSDELLF